MRNWSNFKKMVGISIISISLIGTTIPAIANNISDIEKQQKQLEEEMRKKKTEISNIQRKERNILNELKETTNDVTKINNEINKLEQKIDVVLEFIDSTEGEIKVKQQDVDERSAIFSDRLRQIYMQGDISPLEILLGSESVSDFLTRFEFLKRIAENDVNLLENLKSERTQLEEKKLALEKQKEDIERLKESKETNKRTLQIAIARQKDLLSEVKSERNSLEQMLDEMEKESDKLAQELLKVASKGNFTGTLLWPTPGYTRITSPYGWRIHPIQKTKKFHSGIDVAAPLGSKAIASAAGKVIFTGWRGAYGNTIVVDHGGLTTMYPHLSAILVKTGQYVKQGEQIGKIGSTGWSTGPHIHIEVRVNGEAVDPLEYMKKG